MIDLNRYIELWKKVLTKPEAVYKSEKKRASLNEFAKNLVIAGLIAGLIAGVAGALGISTTSFGSIAGVSVFVASLVFTPIALVIGWLLLSGVLYIFALLLGGKGSYTTQSYLISLYAAPVAILNAIFGLIPIVGPVINILIIVYSLWLLTLALKYAHNFDTGKAILVWLLPVAMILLLVAFLAAAFLTLLFGQLGTGLTV